MSDIPHLGFIIAAYTVTALTLMGAIAVLIQDRRAQTRLLARLAPRDGE